MRLREYDTFASILLTVSIAALFTVSAAFAQNPYSLLNNSWINISGTVESVSANAFLLDYGSGLVTVEMDDGDHDADGYKLIPGDKVTVNGMIDDDLFETTSIEASSVYVEKLDTYFFASAADEEDPYFDFVTPIKISSIAVQGVVTDIDRHEFTIDNALRTVTVDVEKMANDPLDDVGFPKIEVGDIVRAVGTIDNNFFDGRKLVADRVVKLVD